MAIEKEVTRPNGLTFNYHRVVSVNSIVNRENVIEVASYINHAERNKENDAIQNNVPMDVMVSTQYVTAQYDPNMGITGAYQYIKGLDVFSEHQDVFETGNDPVAVADSVASGNTDINDLPEEHREAIEELIPEKPDDKEGYLTVSTVESMGDRVIWEYIPDPHYDPEAEDGSYMRPFKYEQGMDVEAGFWYWLGDKQLPHEAIASGTPTDFYDRDFFDYVEEAQPEGPETPVEPSEPEPEQTPDEPESEPQEPSEPVEDVPAEPVVEDVEKPEASAGDYTDPIPYEVGMEVTAGLWYYLEYPDLPKEAQLDGTPSGWDDEAFLM